MQPVQEEINVRAPSFFIMRAHTPCWKCHVNTAVTGIALSSGFELLENESVADKERAYWSPQTTPGVVYWIEYLAANVAAQIQKINSRYRRDFSVTTKTHYWMNHCEHCNAKQGDNYLYHEQNPPFGRLSVADVASMHFTHIREPFLARVDHLGLADELLVVTQ